MSRKTTMHAGVLLGALLISVGALGLASPAVADQPEPLQVTVPLTFTGYNAERALENGYEVRTTGDGWDYAVPVGSPADSMEGATPLYNPETGEVNDGTGVRSTVPGNCGTSTLTLYSGTSGYTGYNLNGIFGGAVYHEWVINLQSQYGADSVDRSGFPPFPGALNWGTNFSFNVGVAGHGSTYISGIASGLVVTTFGECTGMGARDSIWS